MKTKPPSQSDFDGFENSNFERIMHRDESYRFLLVRTTNLCCGRFSLAKLREVSDFLSET